MSLLGSVSRLLVNFYTLLNGNDLAVIVFSRKYKQNLLLEKESLYFL